MSTLENIPRINSVTLAEVTARFNARFGQNILQPCDPEVWAALVKLARLNGEPVLADEMAAAL